jgi:hypothetical protein
MDQDRQPGLPIAQRNGGVAMGAISRMIFGAPAGCVAGILMAMSARQGCLVNVTVRDRTNECRVQESTQPLARKNQRLSAFVSSKGRPPDPFG